MTNQNPSPSIGSEKPLLKVLNNFMNKNRGKGTFLEREAKGLFKEMGLAVPKGSFIARGEVIQPLTDLAFPLVAKVSSSKITSKSDVGGVKVGIKDKVELSRAIHELMLIENAEGVLVEEMAPQGVEVIVGGVIDNQFGPVVMFGLGGVFVELFRDVAFGLAPLLPGDALWLIQQTKGHRLLDGYRGKPPLDITALIRIISVVSEIMATRVVKEIDLNPVALYPKGSLILDAKMAAIT
ncbi:MAG TPA: acetate--CoA ligase family protein [Thermodesulfovibrionales bacterium]|nr:acetate--CoA ligase family protein [Thermodesulfovibrionales bacterium]